MENPSLQLSMLAPSQPVVDFNIVDATLGLLHPSALRDIQLVLVQLT